MVRAKFKCTEKTYRADDTQNIKMSPVIGESPENKSFYKWTPSGSIELLCLNPNASDKFVVGKEYYIDFTEAV